MELQNVFIYYPDGSKSYHEVGQKLLDENKKETEVMVTKIIEEDKKITLEISTGEKYLYCLPYSSKLN